MEEVCRDDGVRGRGYRGDVEPVERSCSSDGVWRGRGAWKQDVIGRVCRGGGRSWRPQTEEVVHSLYRGKESVWSVGFEDDGMECGEICSDSKGDKM